MRAGRRLLCAGVALLALSACAGNQAGIRGSVPSGPQRGAAGDSLGRLAARYEQHPNDKATILGYAAVLRTLGQPEQAVAVLETGIASFKHDTEIRVAYAKALASAGRFDQALNVVEDAINPAAPDWNALSVKGAILDQSGRNEEARALYRQAQLIAPREASLEANIGLSYAMTTDLDAAEAHLRKASKMSGAGSQIRQNLALIVGLEGRFDESRSMFAAELPPDQVESNMAYIRALLTQQNRWNAIAADQG